MYYIDQIENAFVVCRICESLQVLRLHFWVDIQTLRRFS